LRGALAGEPVLRLVLLLVPLGDLDHERHVLGLATGAREVALELLLLRDEGLNVLLVDQDLLREGEAQATLTTLAGTGIPVL
jgi:hypothetical protein